MYSENEYLLISGIQHFSYCRRQWALIHIDQQWEENALTADGSIKHDRVHSATRTVSSHTITFRSMHISSARLGVAGISDAVEFKPSKEGITLFGYPGTWEVLPVEYKRGASKSSNCDRLQVAVQAMCLEEMMACTIEQGCLFYFSSQKREYFELDDNIKSEAISMLTEMHSLYRSKHIPKVKPGNKCKNCSLFNICMPGLLSNKESVTDYIERYIGKQL